MPLRYLNRIHKQAFVHKFTPPGVVCNANFTALALQRLLPTRKRNPSFVCGCVYTNFVRTLSHRPVSLAYDVLEGDPKQNSLPVVILHGLFGSKNNWSSLTKNMNIALGRKIVAVDARNHGASEHADEMSYEAMCEDTVKLIRDELKVEKCELIGHSMGGKTAMYMALTRPDVVESVLVVDIAPNSVTTVDVGKYMHILMDIPLDHSLSLSQVRGQVANKVKDVIDDASLRYFMVTNIIRDGDKYRWRINMKSILENKDKLAGFPKLDTPYDGLAWFVGGSESNYIGPDSLPEIERLFPGAIIRHIEGAGHWVHSEKPREFQEIIRPFLTST